MDVKNQIANYIDALLEPKKSEIETLHQLILNLSPNCQIWFEDGKNSDGKIVANPNIGYGQYTIHYANGSTRDFFRIGLSANKTGISVYIFGFSDKEYLSKTYGSIIGKAKVTGYCIHFKTIADIHLDQLQNAIIDGFQL